MFDLYLGVWTAGYLGNIMLTHRGRKLPFWGRTLVKGLTFLPIFGRLVGWW